MTPSRVTPEQVERFFELAKIMSKTKAAQEVGLTTGELNWLVWGRNRYNKLNQQSDGKIFNIDEFAKMVG